MKIVTTNLIFFKLLMFMKCYFSLFFNFKTEFNIINLGFWLSDFNEQKNWCIILEEVSNKNSLILEIPLLGNNIVSYKIEI